MTQHHHIDPASLEAALAKVKAGLRDQLSRDDQTGVTARVNFEVGTATHRASIAEVNRGSPPEQIAQAVADSVANVIVNMACNVAGTALPGARGVEADARVIDETVELCKRVHDTIDAMLSGREIPAISNRVEPTPSGRA